MMVEILSNEVFVLSSYWLAVAVCVIVTTDVESVCPELRLSKRVRVRMMRDVLDGKAVREVMKKGKG